MRILRKAEFIVPVRVLEALRFFARRTVHYYSYYTWELKDAMEAIKMLSEPTKERKRKKVITLREYILEHGSKGGEVLLRTSRDGPIPGKRVPEYFLQGSAEELLNLVEELGIVRERVEYLGKVI